MYAYFISNEILFVNLLGSYFTTSTEYHKYQIIEYIKGKMNQQVTKTDEKKSQTQNLKENYKLCYPFKICELAQMY